MKRVLMLLANGFECFEASVFIDVFGWNLVDGDRSTRLFTAGITRQVKSSFDQIMCVDHLLADVDAGDYEALAIPGGFEEYGFYIDAYAEPFSALIQQFHAQSKPIASICTGALPIAASGILKGVRATTYELNPARQRTLADFGAIIGEQRIIEDAGIITSHNPATAIDVALLLLERVTTRENAAHIRRIMGF